MTYEKSITKQQARLMTLARKPEDFKLIQDAVKKIQEAVIDKMYLNIHREEA